MKIKEKLGLDQCKYALSGAAPMTRELQEYFASLGININDTYGMSECCGATTVSMEQVHLWGTVGSAMTGAEVKIFNVDTENVNKKVECPKAKDLFNPTEEEQGEICYRGRHIMLGYLANPKLGEEHVKMIQEKNAETIDEEGYLHSGDKGTCGENGMYRVTGRYKELIIGSGGENIAPVPIEEHIKTLARGISNIIMIGDQRKYNCALVTIRAEGATGELPGNENIDPDAIQYGSDGTKTIEQALTDEKWIKHIQDAIIATNNDGNVVKNNASKIQKFTILPKDFSIQGGELTPTLKLKRAFVDTKYKNSVDNIYDGGVKDMYVPYKAMVQDKTTSGEGDSTTTDKKEEAKPEPANNQI